MISINKAQFDNLVLVLAAWDHEEVQESQGHVSYFTKLEGKRVMVLDKLFDHFTHTWCYYAHKDILLDR